jgi:hypothetical protein
MKRFVLTALLAIAAVPALDAQAALVLPDQPLDSNRAAARDGIYVLRDSLYAVIAGIARLERDFRTTSTQSLTSRARELHSACAAAERNVAPVRKVVGATNTASKLQDREKVRLGKALGSLGGVLGECSAEFERLGTRGNGEEVRGYGNRRAQPVRAEIMRYETAVDGFFRALEIPNRPLGARPDPLAQ